MTLWTAAHQASLPFTLSVQFSRSVVSNSLRPHGLPRVCSNSCPLSRWCYLTISSPATVFSSHPQSFPASGSFPVSWLFTSGVQNIGALTSASILPMNIQGWFPLGLTGWISLQSKGLKNLLQHSWKASVFWHSTLFMVQVSHLYMTTGKTIVLTLQTFVSKVKFLLFNMLSRFVIAFLPRSKHLLISWLQSPSTVINYYAILLLSRFSRVRPRATP